MVPRSPRTTGPRIAAVCAVVPLAALGMTGCSVDAKSAEPAVKTFPFTGRTLNVKTHEIPADLVATDRKDIRVTRWFDAKSGTQRLRWELKGDTLDLEAGCTGLAICDARFKVEVPRDVAVLRDGAKTDLRGPERDRDREQSQDRAGEQGRPGGQDQSGAQDRPADQNQPRPHGKDHTPA
ncbi:hypothetical protein ACH4FX_24510 [Streptomyces sp. NPDC018019]|uniref:hypothetical protein n=1 Tax=Streptomyces sp. NPDC018019 TaxID=3365030 RepID=UPI00378F0A3D